MTRDYQKSKVYRWENENLPKGRQISFDDIRAYVAKVWEEFGLKYPPLVQELPAQTIKAAGKGNRQYVLFPVAGATELVILHELAHSMTDNLDNEIDLHGPRFVGVYMRLVEKFLNGNAIKMWGSAKACDVDFDMFATPSINEVK